MLVSREPDVKTVVKRNDAYWGRSEVPLEVTELTLTTIKQDATRVAALLSGEVDIVQDVPVQDIERLKGSPNLRVTEGPENRTIFFAFDVGSPSSPHPTSVARTHSPICACAGPSISRSIVRRSSAS